LARVGAVGKDFENDLLPVDDGETGELLPIALLCGRERLVEDDHVGAIGFREIVCCAGESASSKTITSAPSAFARSASSFALPLPSSSAGVGRRRLTSSVRVTDRRRFSTSSFNSSRSSAP